MAVYKGEKYIKDITSGRTLVLFDRQISSAFSNHGRKVVDALQRVIRNGARSGRLYIYNGRQHQASAPGEPPANRSDKLADSNAYVARSKELAVFNTAFNKNAPYPSFLEEGTSKMDPRPWFELTIERLEPLLYGELLGVNI